LRSDNKTEFTNGPLPIFFAKNGILYETSCVDTPQENGRIERKNRHKLNVARPMVSNFFSFKILGQMCLAIAYVISRALTKLLSFKMPYEALFGVAPSYNHLRVFECLCYIHNHNKSRDKFDLRDTRYLFL